MRYQYLPSSVQSSSGKKPVLLALHGVGANEKGLAQFAHSLDPRFEVYSLQAPLVLGADSYAWFHVQFTAEGPLHNKQEAEQSRRLLVEFIEDLRRRPDVDADNIFLVGFSQGTIMSLSLALTEPNIVKGVVAIAGRTLQEVATFSKGKEYVQSPKVLLVHGREDGKLPYFHGEKSAEVLKEAGFDFEFKSYTASHEITPAMQVDISVWLKQQLDKK